MSRKCPSCLNSNPKYSKYGFFYRSSDRKKIQRFRCHHCRKVFSQASFQKCIHQNKRTINPKIKVLLSSCLSQRRISKILKVNRKTVARKLKFLALRASESNKNYLNSRNQVFNMQFDDLETFEHSKCKPLSVIMAVEEKTRKILGFRVSQMPAKGHLAKVSRKKYGYRQDRRKASREALFEELSLIVHEKAVITSDESPHYPGSVKKYFPRATHIRVKGRRSCIVGQGELKKIGFDPLFSLNHSFAMLRANINRLVRRTWCTSKNIQGLIDHLHIYSEYHNRVLTG